MVALSPRWSVHPYAQSYRDNTHTYIQQGSITVLCVSYKCYICLTTTVLYPSVNVPYFFRLHIGYLSIVYCCECGSVRICIIFHNSAGFFAIHPDFQLTFRPFSLLHFQNWTRSGASGTKRFQPQKAWQFYVSIFRKHRYLKSFSVSKFVQFTKKSCTKN